MARFKKLPWPTGTDRGRGVIWWDKLTTLQRRALTWPYFDENVYAANRGLAVLYGVTVGRINNQRTQWRWEKYGRPEHTRVFRHPNRKTAPIRMWTTKERKRQAIQIARERGETLTEFVDRALAAFIRRCAKRRIKK